MKKVWSVELRRNYDLNSNCRNYDVIADNAKEAIDKARAAHKRIARKTFDHRDYQCVTKVKLHTVISWNR